MLIHENIITKHQCSIRRWSKSGLSLQQIAKKLNITRESLKSYSRKYKIRFTIDNCAKKYKEIHGTTFGAMKRSAELRGKKFHLPIEHLWDLFIKQSRKCAISGLPLQFQSGSIIYDRTASLDRIDSSKGYVKGNVQWVHTKINYMKMNMDEPEFFALIKSIYKYKRL